MAEVEASEIRSRSEKALGVKILYDVSMQINGFDFYCTTSAISLAGFVSFIKSFIDSHDQARTKPRIYELLVARCNYWSWTRRKREEKKTFGFVSTWLRGLSAARLSGRASGMSCGMRWTTKNCVKFKYAEISLFACSLRCASSPFCRLVTQHAGFRATYIWGGFDWSRSIAKRTQPSFILARVREFPSTSQPVLMFRTTHVVCFTFCPFNYFVSKSQLWFDLCYNYPSAQ